MSLFDHKWSALLSPSLVSGCALLVSACSIVELDKLVPSTAISAIDIVSPEGNLLQYVPNACPNAVATQISKHHDYITNKYVPALRSALPAEISQHAVVQAIINHSTYVSARAVQTASFILDKPDMQTIAEKPPSNIGAREIYDFGKLVMEHVMRHTPSASPGADPPTEEFWNNLKAYYEIYFQNHFTTYLGVPLPAPSPSLTIGDTEIVQAAQVFMEFLLDEIFHSTVWATKDSSSKTVYYPGATTYKPTYLTVNNITPAPLPATTGCGMNVMKAQAINMLVNQFSTAASAEVGLLSNLSAE